jgi:hypothetical protein
MRDSFDSRHGTSFGQIDGWERTCGGRDGAENSPATSWIITSSKDVETQLEAEMATQEWEKNVLGVVYLGCLCRVGSSSKS